MKPDRGFFDRISHSYGERWTIEEESRIVASRAVSASPAGRVLEVGCGNGRLMRNLAAYDILAFGVDSSFEMILEARKRLSARRPASVPAMPGPASRGASVRLVVGEATRLPFRRGAFETVIAVNVIHNQDDPRPWLDEIRRSRPRRVVIDFRNMASPVVAFKYFRFRGSSAVNYQPHFPAAWSRYLRLSGFGACQRLPVRRPLSDPGEGFRWRHVVGFIVSLLPGLAPCYVGIYRITSIHHGVH